MAKEQDNHQETIPTEESVLDRLKSRRMNRRRNAFFFLSGMVAAVLLIILVFNTPLRNYLPGYLDVNKRALLMESAMRIDSLERENDLRSAYLENMTAILRGSAEPDTIRRFDSSVAIMNDTLLPASEREQAFVARYEEQERFGLNALYANEGYQGVSFLKPLKGKIAEPTEDNATEAGTTVIEVSAKEPVLTPQEGTVVAVNFLIGQGYQLVLQHNNEYITIFTHLSTVMVDVGQSLKAGQVVGHGTEWVGIQLWHRGKTVDPVALMSLE